MEQIKNGWAESMDALVLELFRLGADIDPLKIKFTDLEADLQDEIDAKREEREEKARQEQIERCLDILEGGVFEIDPECWDCIEPEKCKMFRLGCCLIYEPKRRGSKWGK